MATAKNRSSAISKKMTDLGHSANEVQLGLDAYAKDGDAGFKSFYSGLKKPKAVTPPASTTVPNG